MPVAWHRLQKFRAFLKASWVRSKLCLWNVFDFWVAVSLTICMPPYYSKSFGWTSFSSILLLVRIKRMPVPHSVISLCKHAQCTGIFVTFVAVFILLWINWQSFDKYKSDRSKVLWSKLSKWTILICQHYGHTFWHKWMGKGRKELYLLFPLNVK